MTLYLKSITVLQTVYETVFFALTRLRKNKKNSLSCEKGTTSERAGVRNPFRLPFGSAPQS